MSTTIPIMASSMRSETVTITITEPSSFDLCGRIMTPPREAQNTIASWAELPKMYFPNCTPFIPGKNITTIELYGYCAVMPTSRFDCAQPFGGQLLVDATLPAATQVPVTAVQVAAVAGLQVISLSTLLPPEPTAATVKVRFNWLGTIPTAARSMTWTASPSVAPGKRLVRGSGLVGST